MLENISTFLNLLEFWSMNNFMLIKMLETCNKLTRKKTWEYIGNDSGQIDVNLAWEG